MLLFIFSNTVYRDLVELVPFKPMTATAEEISRSGLACFKASEVSKMQVAGNTAEKVSHSFVSSDLKSLRADDVGDVPVPDMPRRL